jgi:hypothetical protein
MPAGSRGSCGLGRHDLQRRDQFAGGGHLVLGDAVVAELAEFFEPDAGMAQDFHECPRPEGFAFHACQVGAQAAAGWAGPDGAGVDREGGQPAVGLGGGSEGVAGAGLAYLV